MFEIVIENKFLFFIEIYILDINVRDGIICPGVSVQGVYVLGGI